MSMDTPSRWHTSPTRTVSNPKEHICLLLRLHPTTLSILSNRQSLIDNLRSIIISNNNINKNNTSIRKNTPSLRFKKNTNIAITNTTRIRVMKVYFYIQSIIYQKECYSDYTQSSCMHDWSQQCRSLLICYCCYAFLMWPNINVCSNYNNTVFILSLPICDS